MMTAVKFKQGHPLIMRHSAEDSFRRSWVGALLQIHFCYKGI